MTRRNMPKQGWVFPLFSADTGLLFYITQSVGLGQHCLPKVSTGFKPAMKMCPAGAVTSLGIYVSLAQYRTHLRKVQVSGLYAWFLKGQGHQGIFSLAKGTLWGNCKFLLEHLKGTKAIAFIASVKYQAWVYHSLVFILTVKMSLQKVEAFLRYM